MQYEAKEEIKIPKAQIQISHGDNSILSDCKRPPENNEQIFGR